MTRSTRLVTRTAALALAAALFLAGPAAFAQEAGQSGMQSGSQAAPDFAASDLESFVDAQGKVREVGMKYQEKVKGADPQQMGAIRQEMNQEMVEAVRSSGLDVQTYNEIANAAQSDPELAEKIQGMTGGGE